MQLLDHLWEERNSIFSEALDELYLLTKNKFVFEEPEDSKKVKVQMRAKGSCISDFINDCCIREQEERVYFCTLYEAFKEYCENNLLDVKITKTQFNQRISLMPGMIREKMRIKSEGGKPLWGVRGIRLKKLEEYNLQDSDSYSRTAFESDESWNNGTMEQEV